MAPIFASADIAALVAAYPPPRPAKAQPSLVRSTSGNKLLNSHRVLSRLDDVLTSSSTRVRTKDIPTLLGIGDADWLWQCYHRPPVFSRDGQALIPAREAHAILDQLFEAARLRFVELAAFAMESDVALSSLDRLLDDASIGGVQLRTFSASESVGQQWVCVHSLLAKIEEAIVQAVQLARPGKCDLTNAFPNWPGVALVELARKLEQGGSVKDGAFDYAGDKIVFMPAEYYSKLESRRRREAEEHIQRLLSHMETDGFCRLPENYKAQEQMLQEEVSTRYEDQHHGTTVASAQMCDENNSTTLLIPSPLLADTLAQLKEGAAEYAVRWFRDQSHEDSPVFSLDDEQAINTLASSCPPPNRKLAALVLHTTHCNTISSSALSKISELETLDRETFVQTFRERILAPMHLYAAGVDTISDATLKQHLTEYVHEYLRGDVLSATLRAMRESGGILRRLPRERKEVGTFAQTVDSTESLNELQAGAAKVARKLKIEPPDTDLLRTVKQRTLQLKAAALQKMSRGSDVLQNLLWILLAENGEGLWVSRGKDTSRLIRHYRGLGDERVAERLEGWRDGLKSGHVGAEEMGKMREMGRGFVERAEGGIED